MGNRFVNSANGSPVAPYDTPATAANSVLQVLDGSVVLQDEIIWVINTHVESHSAGTLWYSEGATPSHPLRILCTSDWVLSPASLTTGASILTYLSSPNLQVTGSFYIHGLAFESQQYYATLRIGEDYSLLQGSCSTFVECVFTASDHSTGRCFQIGSYVGYEQLKPCFVKFKNCSVRFKSVDNSIDLFFGRVLIENLTIHASSLVPTVFFKTAQNSVFDLTIDNSDLASKNVGGLLGVSTGCIGDVKLKNSKILASTLRTSGTSPHPGYRVTLINCDSGDTHTNHEQHEYMGVWSVSTTIYATTDPADMSVGANDTYSIKMAASANVSRQLPLYSQWMEVWNDGTVYTPTIEVLVQGDGATALLSDELWIEVDYNSGTDSPLGTRLTTCPELLTAGATVAAGTTAWTGDGYSTERTHKLSTTAITPDKPGYIRMRVALAKSSSTVYVNPPR